VADRSMGAIARIMVPIAASSARGLNRVLRPAGIEIVRPRFEPWVGQVIKKTRPFTLTTSERVSALCHAVCYVARSKIPGDIIECGVWRGGSMMAAAMTLLIEQDLSRTLYLFDTFEGMPPPTEADRLTVYGRTASSYLEKGNKAILASASIEEVHNNMASTNYPADRMRFIVGKVEDTIPKESPDRIAILRLDMDWYEPTRHALIHLYRKLVVGGVLIIDDYGHWEGVRKAVDEFINENKLRILLNRIDNAGRIAVKTEPT
jgi:O-methyltransferase